MWEHRNMKGFFSCFFLFCSNSLISEKHLKNDKTPLVFIWNAGSSDGLGIWTVLELEAGPSGEVLVTAAMVSQKCFFALASSVQDADLNKSSPTERCLGNSFIKWALAWMWSWALGRAHQGQELRMDPKSTEGNLGTFPSGNSCLPALLEAHWRLCLYAQKLLLFNVFPRPLQAWPGQVWVSLQVKGVLSGEHFSQQFLCV